VSEPKLVFNGLRPDGSPGLEPMTAEALANHIQKTGDAEAARIKDLENELKRAFADSDKALQIVEMLVESQEQFFRGELASREAWVNHIARKILAIVLGAGVEIDGLVQDLANTLRVDTVGRVQQIVRDILRKNQAGLQSVLLGISPDAADFEKSIKEKAKQFINYINRTLLADAKGETLAGAVEERRLWFVQLAQLLATLPVESIKSLDNHGDTVSKALSTLLEKIQRLPEAQNGQLQALIQRLTPLSDRGRSVLWVDLVNHLATGLDAVSHDAGIDWPALVRALRDWLGQLPNMGWELGVVPWIDPRNLQQTGWGVIFPQYMPSERVAKIKEALSPLLCHRLIQVDLAHLGLNQDVLYTKSLDVLLALRDEKDFHPKWQELFQIYDDKGGYRPNDTARLFLNREGRQADPSKPVDPAAGKVPYYLLLVGGPEEIPFEFQYGLDVQFAVGRIDFGDDEAAYRRYAENVVAAERGRVTPSSNVTFFAVHNKGDVATELSRDFLAVPLRDSLVEHQARYTVPWNFELIQDADANKARLLTLLRDAQRPALLFTTSHGLEFDYAKPEHRARQAPEQGAIVCSDWPEAGTTEVKPEHYLCGRDVREAGALDARGMIAFFFACYGAGTPLYDEYYRQRYKTRAEPIAERAFLADLPRALLSLERGALAVVGHVERAWGTSFLSDVRADPQALRTRSRAHVAVFEAALDRLLQSYPLGEAMDFFNIRYAALSAEITTALDSFTPVDAHKLAELWTTTNDARGYIIIGDPAVRLPLPQNG
jgi:hypothetical protein